MQIYDRRLDDSIFLGLAPGVDRNMTLGELFERGVIEIKVSSIETDRVSLTIDVPEPITVIRAELLSKTHGTDFPSHAPIQGGG